MENHLPLKKRKITQDESIDIDLPSSVSSNDNLNLKRKSNRLRYNQTRNSSSFVEIENAFRGILKTYFLKNNNKDFKDICLLLLHYESAIITIIKSLLLQYGAIKFNILVECRYIKPLSNEIQNRAFKTINEPIYQSSSIINVIHKMFRKICKEESEYQGKGSGWTLYFVDGILLRFSKFTPLSGSTYMKLPKSIQFKKAVVNPQNMHDNECFKWAILARYVDGLNKHKIDHRYYQMCHKFNFENLNFPVTLKDITKFEKNNKQTSVNVYGLKEKSNEIYPLRVSANEKLNHFDLLLISNNSGNNHYCYIVNLSRLLRSQISKHTKSMVFCKRCLAHYQGSKRFIRLKKHKNDCCINSPVKAKMPSLDENDEKPILKFKNYHFKHKVPIVAYCDFECILRNVDTQQSKYTTINEIHEPMSFCVYLAIDNALDECIALHLPKEPYLYRGKDAALKFMEYLISIANLIGDLIAEKNVPMLPLTIEEQNRVNLATHCEFCNTEFSMIDYAVKDHCHLTGKFRNVLCNTCNLKRKNQRYLPVFLHGSSNYDSHFIVRQLGCDNEKIGCIPNTTEKYISFTKKTISGITLRFLDSFKFLGTSLSQLVYNLPLEKFYNIRKFYSNEDIPLVTRKGVYCYDYTDCWEKLEELELPSKENFYNKLTDEPVSDEDYEHAKRVWNHFNCTTLGSYSDLYLCTDVLLLSDVFQNFREISLENYDLDPAHYLTLPSLTFDAMLKYTNVSLELITDYDKYMFIEKGIRGGIVSCIKRHAFANNKDLGPQYNENSKPNYLVYIDANNLYGFSMCELMAKDGFKWLTKSEIKTFDVLTIPDNSPIGYFIECDVEYPTSLHDSHNDLPFLCEKKYPTGQNK